jgi:hypothetical protein
MFSFLEIFAVKFNTRMLDALFCVRRLFLFSVCLAVLLQIMPHQVFAEGSRDLYPKGAIGYRAYLMARGIGTTDAFDPFSNSGVTRVYAKAGEVIYAGSSIVGKRYNSGAVRGNIILKSPSGTEYTISETQLNVAYQSRVGLIESRKEEVAGPNRPGVTDGYTPFAITVPPGEDGIWEVQFVAPKNSDAIPSSNLPTTTALHPVTLNDGVTYPTTLNANFKADSNWLQPVVYYSGSTYHEMGLIAAWDVSVASSATSGNLILGRVFSNVANLTGPNSKFNELSFYGKFVVLTPSGYSYTVDANGLNGAAFNFFSNNKGIISIPSNFSSPSLYQSLAKSTYADLSANIWDPRKPDDYVTNNYTNKLFYNKPAADLPANANTYYSFSTNGLAAGTPYGNISTWLKTVPIPPTVSNLRISCSGLIRFASNVRGTFRILIDCNNNGNYDDALDRVIISQAVVGENGYQWDQLNGLGTRVSNNSNVSIKVYITTAEVHFPFIDVEANKNGIKIFQNDTGYNQIDTADRIFWVDSASALNKGTSGEAAMQTPPSPRLSEKEGTHSKNGEHKWGSTDDTGTPDTKYWGNNRTIDTWAFVNTNVVGMTSICVSITGAVFNDTDGVTNINPSGGLLLPTGLYATLVNGSNVAVKSVKVENGYYDFTNVENGNYTVVLSTSLNGTTAALPSGWTNVGEDCCDNIGNDGQANGRVSVPINGSSVINANFGIKSSGPITVSGIVYNDNNGLSDGSVNGTLHDGGTGSTLTAYLVDEQGQVVGSSTVASNGTYSIGGAYPSVPYTVRLSNTAGVTIGNLAPESSLPNGYQNTGEAFGLYNNAGTGTERTTPGVIAVTPISSGATGVNFGINLPPTATSNSLTGQTSGVAATVPNILSNDSDPNGGTLVAGSISLVVPVGATNVQTDAQGDVTGFTVPGEGSWSLNSTSGDVTFTPQTGFIANPTPIKYTVTDAAGLNSNEATITITYNPVTVTGNVFHDPYGGFVDNSSGKTNTVPTGMYANLVDVSGKVIMSVPVSTNGTFSFTGMASGTYSVQLSNGQLAANSTAPTSFTPPSGWVMTGAYNGTPNTGNTGNLTGRSNNFAVNSNVTNINFGMEQLPTANNVNGTFVNPGSTNTITVPALNGSDPEQGVFPGTGNVDTIVIKTLPASGTLYYNNIPVVAGDTIRNYNPSLLKFDPPSGTGVYTFDYVEIDAALKASNVATATLTVTALTISGNVLNDANGLLGSPANTVDGMGTNAGGLNAVLINSVTGKVAAVAVVGANGVYTFSGVDIGNYSVVITTNGATVGSNPPALQLPDNWVNVGENFGAGEGSDGKVDGSLSLGSVTVSINNANFGIERKPIPNDVTWVVDNVRVNIPYNLGTNLVNAFEENRYLNGTDHETNNPDGSSKIIMDEHCFKLTTLPDAAYVELYYDADGEGGEPPVKLVAHQLIPDFDPMKLSVVFVRRDAPPEMTFTYDFADEAGVFSDKPATYTIQVNSILPVSGLILSGTYNGSLALLSWSTITEQNTASFIIERSVDGVRFIQVKQINAAGNSNGLKRYSYNDAFTTSNAVWYRVKLKDLDGSTVTSNVISLAANQSGSIKVYPNPAQQYLTVSGLSSKAEIRLLNVAGKMVMYKNEAGSNTSQLNIGGLTPGVYLVQVFEKGKLVSTKMVVKN